MKELLQIQFNNLIIPVDDDVNCPAKSYDFTLLNYFFTRHVKSEVNRTKVHIISDNERQL